MSDRMPREVTCSDVEKHLSAFFDGEVDESLRMALESHLRMCSACRQELDHFEGLRSILRTEGRRVSVPSVWRRIESSLHKRSDQIQRSGLVFGMSRTLIAATAASLLLGIMAVWFFMGDFAGLRGPDGKTYDQATVYTAGLPGLGDFLSRHRAKEVQVSALTESLEFLPVVPEGLPGGFRLEKTYVVTDSRGTGCCAVYRYGEEVLALVQSAPAHPVKWAVDQLEGCTIAGLFCRRGSDRGVDLVQIEPNGRNLTVIARAGAIESTPLVRALTGR